MFLVNLWNDFARNHPGAAKWIREGGLFVIVSNLVTVLKYFILQFLPAAFTSLSNIDFGWPHIPITLFGETFFPAYQPGQARIISMPITFRYLDSYC